VERGMSDPRKLVSSGSPYEPIIGFSRAVRVANIVAVGGTAPIGKDGKTVGVGDPAAQTRRCFEIIEQALKEAGAGLDQVVRTRTFLTDISQWEEVGRAHGEIFGEIRPASTMVQVTRFIDPDWLVEIEADAVVTDDPRVWQNAWAPSEDEGTA
jgi:enamine deaminase RidA (YjgF/YER057c/UK114 family)